MEAPLRLAEWDHMIVQKPDVVGLLCGSLLGVSPGCFNDLKEAGQSLPVGMAVERAQAACSGSSFCHPLWTLPLPVGYRAVGSRLKLPIPPFSGTLSFSEVYSQATQEAGDMPGLQSWVKVVWVVVKGQRQRGSGHWVFPSTGRHLPQLQQ